MSEEIYQQAGRRIRALRERSGLSREQLAELAHISSKFLYDIEVGNKGFSAKVLFFLAKSLHISCDYIIFGDMPYHRETDIIYILHKLPAKKKADVIRILSILCRLMMP